ncbi:hypothetical protein BC829DRAFT_436820 [Chytridium lagenaria]|nr:hypothetical protein BC829DRAFT_436820 [Chytridium lagenaria]
MLDEDVLLSIEEKVSKEHALYLRKRLEDDIDDKRVVAYLRVLASDRQGEEQIAVNSGINVVGRAGGRFNGVSLDTVGVSSVHAIIEVSEDGLEHFVEDLQSTNGTCIGMKGYKLFPNKLYELAHNKMIAFGPTTCFYERVNPGIGLGEYSDDVIQDADENSSGRTLTSNPSSENSSQITRPIRSAKKTRRVEDSESDSDIEEIRNAPLDIKDLPATLVTGGGRRNGSFSVGSKQNEGNGADQKVSPTLKVVTLDDDDDDEDLLTRADLLSIPTRTSLGGRGSSPRSGTAATVPPTQIASSETHNAAGSGIPSTGVVPHDDDDEFGNPVIFDDMGSDSGMEVGDTRTQHVEWNMDDLIQDSGELKSIPNTQSQSLSQPNKSKLSLHINTTTTSPTLRIPSPKNPTISPTFRVSPPPIQVPPNSSKPMTTKTSRHPQTPSSQQCASQAQMGHPPMSPALALHR